MDTLYRRWLILNMIPRHGNSITTTSIAEKLAASTLEAKSVRTIQRDLEELSGIFPLTSTQYGRTFHWSWIENAPRYDIPVMDPQTALTFCLTDDYISPMLPKTSLRHLEPYFTSARKILAENPEMSFSRWRNKVKVVSRNLKMEKPQFKNGVTTTIYDALLRECRISVRYRHRDEAKAKEYSELNPLGLVFVDNLIYLVASVKDYQNPLQFLLHRMEAATILEKPVTIPEGFTLQGYIESGEFSYPLGKETIYLKAHFDSDTASYLRETPLLGTIGLTVVDEDTLQLEAEVLDSHQLRWWLRGFGEKVEVLEPAELREEFKELAKALKRVYR